MLKRQISNKTDKLNCHYGKLHVPKQIESVNFSVKTFGLFHSSWYSKTIVKLGEVYYTYLIAYLKFCICFKIGDIHNTSF